MSDGIQYDVKLITNTVKVLGDLKLELDGVTVEIATDILNRAIMNAPKASGALVRSGRVTKATDGGYTVTFGDNAVRYAYRRHFENKKHPETLLYLENAGDTVVKGNVQKYFR